MQLQTFMTREHNNVLLTIAAWKDTHACMYMCNVNPEIEANAHLFVEFYKGRSPHNVDLIMHAAGMH